jgi:uncharacterized protein YtpQ (UPF0354 family)
MTLIFRTLCLALALATSAAAETPRPQDRLETLFLLDSAIRSAAPDLVVTMDGADISLKIALSDGTDYLIYPDNLHLGLQKAETAAEREALLEGHVVALLDAVNAASAPSEAGLDLDRVMPLLRPADVFQTVSADTLPHETFPGDLVVYWVIDSDTQTTSVGTDLLRDSGLSQTVLAEKALQNLQSRAADLTPQPVGGATAMVLDRYYESSLLLLPDVWTAIDAQIGTVVVAVPTRDLVMYVDGDDPDSLTDLRNFACLQFESSPYQVSRALFRWDGDHWTLLP